MNSDYNIEADGSGNVVVTVKAPFPTAMLVEASSAQLAAKLAQGKQALDATETALAVGVSMGANIEEASTFLGARMVTNPHYQESYGFTEDTDPAKAALIVFDTTTVGLADLVGELQRRISEDRDAVVASFKEHGAPDNTIDGVERFIESVSRTLVSQCLLRQATGELVVTGRERAWEHADA